MAQWNYLSTFLEANAKDDATKQFIEQNFSKKAKKHSPEALIPELDKLGQDGWELVHMEPVPNVGRKEDIQFDPYKWSNIYFCVFKKRLDEPQPFQAQAAAPAEPDVKIPPVQLNPNTMP